MLIEGLVHGALRKKLPTAPFAERFKTATLGKSYWEILLVFGTIYLDIAFLPKFLRIKGSVQGALRKELFIALFVVCLKAATLGKSYWEILPVLGTIYLNIVFLSNFDDRRLSTRCPTKGAPHCSFRRAPYKSYFGKVLLRDFVGTWNNFLQHCISAKCLLI